MRVTAQAFIEVEHSHQISSALMSCNKAIEADNNVIGNFQLEFSHNVMGKKRQPERPLTTGSSLEEPLLGGKVAPLLPAATRPLKPLLCMRIRKISRFRIKKGVMTGQNTVASAVLIKLE